LRLAVFTALVIALCAAAGQARVVISNVVVTSAGGDKPPHDVTYTISGLPASNTATVSIQVKDNGGNVVAAIKKGDPPACSWQRGPGRWTDRWGGTRDSDGRQSPDGNYQFTINAGTLVPISNYELLIDGIDACYWGCPGVNRNKQSPYYGYMYLPNGSSKKVHTYNPVGVEVGTGVDPGGTSINRPFGVAVANNDDVYVLNRQAMTIWRYLPSATAGLTGGVEVTANCTGVRKNWGGGIDVLGSGINTRLALNDDYANVVVYKASAVDGSNRPTCWTVESTVATGLSSVSSVRFDPGCDFEGSPAYGRVFVGLDADPGIRRYDWDGSAWVENVAWRDSQLPNSPALEVLPDRDTSTPPRATKLIIGREQFGTGTALYRYNAQSGGIEAQWTGDQLPMGSKNLAKIRCDAVGNLLVTDKQIDNHQYQGMDWQLWGPPDAGAISDNSFSKGFAHVHLPDPQPVFLSASISVSPIPADGATTTTIEALVKDTSNMGAPWDVASVTVNLSSLGGSSNAPMTDHGMAETDPTVHRYTLAATAAVGTPAGSYSLTITATDTTYQPDPPAIVTTAVSLEVTALPIEISHTFACAGWQLLSIPLEPVDPDGVPICAPEEVFFVVELGRTLDASELASASLTRYDDLDKSYVAYDEFNPGIFGCLTPGHGCWFYYDQPFTLRYWGLPRAGDVEFELKYPGWNIVGYGQLQRQSLGDPAGDGVGGISIVNNGLGGAVDTFRNAWYTNGWISGPLQTWDPANLAYFTVGVDCPAFEWNASVVSPWFGYWFNSNAANLRWRMPLPSAVPTCEP